jgi:hypothetical protein
MVGIAVGVDVAVATGGGVLVGEGVITGVDISGVRYSGGIVIVAGAQEDCPNIIIRRLA